MKVQQFLTLILLFALLYQSHASIEVLTNFIAQVISLLITVVFIVVRLVLEILSVTGENLIPSPPPTYSTVVTLADNITQVGGAILPCPNTNKTYYQYKGIPFANKVKRFEEAEAKSPDGSVIHNGVEEGKVCPQALQELFYLGEIDEENCLVLTVSTPVNPNNFTSPLPVLVFIHGGFFLIGTTKKDWYNPECLVCQDVVVVHMQYRMGTLGFVSDGTEIPRNLGLKDVILALKWVKTNVRKFGGDPDRITLSGESAGSIMTSILWQYPETNHMFQQIALDSGTSLNYWSYQPNPAKAFQKVVENGLCIIFKNSPVQVQLQCLKSISASAIATANLGILVGVDIFGLGVMDGFVAAIVPDGDIVTKSPYERLSTGDFPKDKPVYVAMNNEEGQTFEIFVDILRFRQNNVLAPAGILPANRDNVGGLIKAYYAGAESNWDTTPSANFVRFVSNALFDNAFRQYIEFIQPQLATQGTPLYCMQFSYASKMGIFNNGNDKVGHADDLFYTWGIEALGNQFAKGAIIEPHAYVVKDQMCKLLANFVKTGNPTPTIDPLFENLTWPAVADTNNVECLNVDEELSIISNPKQDAYQHWSSWYANYGNPVNVF